MNPFIHQLPIKVIIMAGGRGERLAPLTRTTPKPLLLVHGKPLLDHIIEYVVSFQLTDITISVGYLGEQIKQHVSQTYADRLSIGFIDEHHPLGTIGAVSLLTPISQPFTLVINADVLTDLNIYAFFAALQQQKADLIMATQPQTVAIPYGVIELDDNGYIDCITEKPIYTFQVNAGIYLFRSELAQYIPTGQRFDATELVSLLANRRHKLIAWPIDGYWFDVGSHEVYEQCQQENVLVAKWPAT